MNGLSKAKQVIRRAKTIAIAGHINPDGDSIGSTIALGLGLESLGKRVYMISHDGVPHRYRMLPGSRRIIKGKSVRPDLAIAVDCSTKSMLGAARVTFESAADIIEIDHHDFRRPFGNISLVDTGAAAIGEMVYVLLKSLGVTITADIAQSLLTSIIVETSSFRLPNVRPFTFQVCNALIKRGVDYYKLIDTVFWSKTPASALLSGICLSRCSFRKDSRLVWSIVRRADFRAAGGSNEDVDTVPDDMRAIEGVRVVVLFRENDAGSLRVSLRSKGRINVALLAEHYGGGGHIDVAGCLIANRPESVEEFLRRTERLLD